MLRPAQWDLARAVVRHPCNFEFLAVAQHAHERHVAAGLIAHMREFVLGLGTGFVYAGNRYRPAVGRRELFLDLPFDHKRPRVRRTTPHGDRALRPRPRHMATPVTKNSAGVSPTTSARTRVGRPQTAPMCSG